MPASLKKQLDAYAEAHYEGNRSAATVHLLRVALKAEQTPLATKADLDALRVQVAGNLTSIASAIQAQPIAVAAALPPSEEQLEKAREEGRREESERIKRVSILDRIKRSW